MGILKVCVGTGFVNEILVLFFFSLCSLIAGIQLLGMLKFGREPRNLDDFLTDSFM